MVFNTSREKQAKRSLEESRSWATICYIFFFFLLYNRRSTGRVFLKAIPPPPIPGLPLEERAHRPQVSLVAEEIGFLGALGPEVDGVGEGLDGLAVAADEGAPEVDVGEGVLFALEVGDLADVVAGVVSGKGLHKGEGGGERERNVPDGIE